MRYCRKSHRSCGGRSSNWRALAPLVLLLLLLTAIPVMAYYAPVRTWTNQSTSSYVRFTLTNPYSGGSVMFNRDYSVAPTNVTTSDGIAAWVDHTQYWYVPEAPPVGMDDYGIRLLAYDPGHPDASWRQKIVGTSYFVDDSIGFRIDDGVVAWVTTGTGGRWVNYYTYDPRDGDNYQWKGDGDIYKCSATNPLPSVYVKDGVVVFVDDPYQASYPQTGLQYMAPGRVHYAIYDPEYHVWKKGSYEYGTGSRPAVTITNATVFWTVGGTAYSAGYYHDYNGGSWRAGVSTNLFTTQRFAYFVASPKDADPTLLTWFTDISIAPHDLATTGWAWRLRTGSGTNLTAPSGRSPYYQFTTSNAFWAYLSIPGDSSEYYDWIRTDRVVPTPGTASVSPIYTNDPTFLVNYAGAYDRGYNNSAGSGLYTETLYWRKSTDTAWTQGSIAAQPTQGSGSISFTFPGTAPANNGTYCFDLVAADWAGKISAVPVQNTTPDCSVIYDTVVPVINSATCDKYDRDGSITIAYSTSDPAPASGVKTVTWYHRREGTSTWTQGGSSTNSSGTFTFTAPNQAKYYFHVVVEDNAGNTTDAPVPDANGMCYCTYDSTCPSPGTATCPRYITTSSITVSYSGCEDPSGSGVSKLTLYYRRDGSSTWSVGGTINSPSSSGSFSAFSLPQEGKYYFDLVAEDSAGNKYPSVPLPSNGTGDCICNYDDTNPSPGTAYTAQSSYNTSTFTVQYHNATDYSSGSGLKYIYLYYKVAGGSWTQWSQSSTPNTSGSGSFEFTAPALGTYYFDLRAEDYAGNMSAVPTSADGDCGVEYETTAPTVVSTDPADDATSVPLSKAITVTFSEDLKASTVNTSTFLVNDSADVALEGTPSCDGNTATFTPTSEVELNTEYTVTLTSGITDVAGNALTEYTFNYTTGNLLTTLPDRSSSPTLADVNGDGQDEVIVGCADSTLHVLDTNGRDIAGWPQTLSSPVNYPAAVADLDNDGALEIIAAGGGDGWGGDLYVFEASGVLASGSWPQETTTPTYFEASSAPAIGDIDSDGDLEIVMGSSTMCVAAYERDGSFVAGWPKSAMDPVYGAPALGDIDGDGALEVVAGDTAGCLWAWNGDGSPVSTWPVDTQMWMHAITSGPSLADLDHDGKQEIIACTHEFGLPGGYIMVLNEDGTEMPGWPKYYSTTGIFASPAIADVDGNGDLDIVIVYNDGKVMCWTPAGTRTAGWPAPVPDISTTVLPSDYSYLGSSTVVADVDADHSVEIIVGSYDGAAHVLNNDGSPLDGWPKTISATRATPAVSDIDGNGEWDVVIGSEDGGVYRWEIGGNSAIKPASMFPWTSFHGDSQHSSNSRIMGQDDFNRTTGTRWDVATYGGPWEYLNYSTGLDWSEPYIYLTANKGGIEPGFGGLPEGVCLLGQPAADMDVTAKLGVADFMGECGLVARASSNNTFYAATWSFFTELRLERNDSGLRTIMQSLPWPVFADNVRVRLRVEGNTIMAKIWEETAPEPEAWSVVAVDMAPLPAGKAGVWVNDVDMLYFFDDYLAESLSR